MPDNTGPRIDPSPDPSTEPGLAHWLHAVATELDVAASAPSHAQTKLLLDTARDAAHQVERPAAPLTTYLLGVAVGRGLTLAEAAERVEAALAARESE